MEENRTMEQTTPAYPDGALEHLRAADPVLARLIDEYGLVVRERDRPPFYALMSAIVGQQISVKAAAAIMARLLALFPAGRQVGPAELAEVSIEQLRAVGLSAAKAAYMHDLASKVAGGQVNLEQLPGLDDEAAIGVLTSVKGIGRWTAEMFLIFSLGRLDVLAVDDLGLRAGIRLAYGMDELPKAAAIRALAEPWRPYRTIATFYFWHHLHNMPLSY
ncbi:MAG TPA: DNA-3-methyladenine glycosylase [Kouleothrix sp.]|uniref:DNA-3-methyladenine glycosylase family protein n=1 Tax=Kouleothrix sp. TaxID=2779161 RepID=UPI002CCFFDA1|nr:DNA-3-methyladenine glycosylase [Kouleothrix sp.]